MLQLNLLSNKYGQEVRNIYSEGGLNRLSFLREDNAFLYKAIKDPSCRFLVFGENQDVLLNSFGNGLEWGVKYADVEEIIGAELAYGKPEKDIVAAWDSASQKVGVARVVTVFLGIDETRPGIKVDDTRSGAPLFAVNLSTKSLAGDLKSKVEKISATILETSGGRFVSGRSAHLLDQAEYAIYGHAKMYIDWNTRNKFCAGCGRPLMSVNGGCKLICPPTDGGVELGPCETRGVITNLSFPRTDCCVIAAILNYSGTAILLGNGKRFPHPKLYSTLAGFLEPGESIEECVRREIWEEAGVAVGRVHIHSSQPWPYPANIMLGCLGQIKDDSEEAHNIYLGHDPELRDAQWVPIDKVQKYLDYAERNNTFGPSKSEETDNEMFVPPANAIAHVIMKAAVDLAKRTDSKI